MMVLAYILFVYSILLCLWASIMLKEYPINSLIENSMACLAFVFSGSYIWGWF